MGRVGRERSCTECQGLFVRGFIVRTWQAERSLRAVGSFVPPRESNFPALDFGDRKLLLTRFCVIFSQ